MSVPTNFEALTLVSNEARSGRPHDPLKSGPRELTKRALDKFAKPIPLGFYFDTRAHEPNNISHLLLNIVPLCLLAREAVEDVTFVFGTVQPRFREMLNYFGIEPLCTYRSVTGQALTFHLSRQISQFPIETIIDYPFNILAEDIYKDFVEERVGAKKIFVSRRGKRSLINEAEVCTFLEARGYTTVYFEDHSIADQISIMQAADDIVAIHGAAMAYLALKEHIGSVIELLPPTVYHSLFPIACHRAERFAQLLPELDENAHFAGWSAILPYKQRAFSVDINQLRRALDEG